MWDMEYTAQSQGTRLMKPSLGNNLAKDLSRARKVLSKRKEMSKTFERWREVGVLIGNTSKA